MLYTYSMELSMNIPWKERLIWLASAALNELAALAHLTGGIKPPPFDANNVSEWMTLEPRVSQAQQNLDPTATKSAFSNVP
jgi:hypothetical protein